MAVALPDAPPDPSARLSATISAEPETDVTTPMTWPATPSPEVASAAWSSVRSLSPSCRFVPSTAETSEASIDVSVETFRPTKLDASFVPVASPDEAPAPSETLRASTVASPDETMPVT